MTDPVLQSKEDEEFDMLDILVTVAENIKLLVMGPLLVGLLVFCVVSVWPATYESSFILQAQKRLGKGKDIVDLFTPAQVSQLATSNIVFADAAKTLQDAGKGEWSTLLRPSSVSAQVLRSTTYVQVTVKAQDPLAANAVAQALLQASLARSKPQGATMQDIQVILEKDKNALANARLLESRFSVAINTIERADPVLTQAYIALLDTIPNLVQSLSDTNTRLNGLTLDDVVAQPVVPTVSSSPNRTHLTTMSFLASCFVLLVWVFVRQAFHGVSISASSASKIERIRKALALKAHA